MIIIVLFLYIHQNLMISKKMTRFFTKERMGTYKKNSVLSVEYSFKGLSIIDVCSQGSLPSVGILQIRRRGSSDANICTFWCKKTLFFRNLWWVRTDKREVNFSQFSPYVLYGWPNGNVAHFFVKIFWQPEDSKVTFYGQQCIHVRLPSVYCLSNTQK